MNFFRFLNMANDKENHKPVTELDVKIDYPQNKLENTVLFHFNLISTF